MNKQEIIDRLEPIITEVFGQTNTTGIESLSPDNVDQWNSLHHVIFIDAIEKAFSINFDFDEMLEIYTVSDIIEMLIKKTKP